MHSQIYTSIPLNELNSLFATFADLHVCKVATFANLHSYTHAYCSNVLLKEAIPIVSGSHCAHALLIWLFGFSRRFTGKKIQRVEKKYFQKWCPNSSALLLKEAIPIVSGSHCAHALLIWLFGFSRRFTGKKIQRVEKKYFQKWCPNSSALQNNVAHRGFVRGKERVKGIL